MLVYIGQVTLVQDQSSSCSNGTAVYRCSRHRPVVRWDFYTTEGNFYFKLSEGSDQNTTLGDALVMFKVTNYNDSYISVTATVPNIRLLNGANMSCHGYRLQIVENEGKLRLFTSIEI